MKVNIPEKYTDLYVKALEDKKKVLNQKISQFQAEIAEIDAHLAGLLKLAAFSG